MINTLAQRMQLRMQELGIKQADLVKKNIASKGTISLWLSGSAIPSNLRLVNLANELKVSTTWLLSGVEDKPNGHIETNNHLSQNISFAPLISWSQVINWINMKNLTTNKQIPLIPGAGDQSFYLEVHGIANSPYYQDGEKICIDPQYQLEDIDTGEMIVMSYEGNPIFRALLKSENKFYLKALNKDWQPNILEINDQCTFIGKYVGSFKEAIKHQLS